MNEKHLPYMRCWRVFWCVMLCFIGATFMAGRSVSQGQENLPTIIKRVEPSIVVILTYNKQGQLLGQGTGFFINKEGDVITNHHVLQGASRAEVKTNDGKTYAAKKSP